MGYDDVLMLPYVVFLSLLKQFQLMELRKNPDYIKAEKKQRILQATEPEMERLMSYMKEG